MNETTIKLCAQLIGKPRLNFHMAAELDEPIDAMFHCIAEKLALADEPTEFHAYAATQNGEWPLTERPNEQSMDLRALDKRDPDVMATYMTPNHRLDPVKTIADYFDDAQLDAKSVHVLIDWSPASWNEHFVRMRHTEAQYLAEQRREIAGRKFHTAPEPEVVFTGIQIRVLVVGTPNSVVSVMVEPDDAIAKLLGLLAYQLYWLGKPHVVAVYVAKLGDQWPLKVQMPEGVTLTDEATDTIDSCRTPGNRLDPAKKVGDYFGKGDDVEPGTIAMVLVGTSASDSTQLAISDAVSLATEAVADATINA